MSLSRTWRVVGSFVGGAAILVTSLTMANALSGISPIAAASADEDAVITPGADRNTSPAESLTYTMATSQPVVSITPAPTVKALTVKAPVAVSPTDSPSPTSVVAAATSAPTTAATAAPRAGVTIPTRDDFKRVVQSGWGRGPLGLWEGEGSTAVAKGVGSILHGFGTARINGLAGKWSLPIEVVVKQAVNTGSARVAKPESHFGITTTASGAGRTQGASVNVEWVPFAGRGGDTIGLSLKVTVAGPSGRESTIGIARNVVSNFSGGYFWTRVVVDEHGVRARGWKDGEVEPSTWQVDAPVTLTAADVARFNSLYYLGAEQSASSNEGAWTVDLIEVVRGFAATR